MVIAVLFSISMDIEASVRMESLGEYFSFIIPDVETDIEQFPTHLQEYDGKFVQLIRHATQKQVFIAYDDNHFYYHSYPVIDIRVLPVLGKFTYKLDFGISAYGFDNIIYKYYRPSLRPYYYDDYEEYHLEPKYLKYLSN